MRGIPMKDITESHPGCVKAEQEGKNVLIMRRLDNPLKRFDGKMARYELDYRWLSDTGGVLGNELSYWLKSEYDQAKGLFEQFQLF